MVLLKPQPAFSFSVVSLDFKSWGCHVFDIGTRVLNASQLPLFSYFSKALGPQTQTPLCVVLPV